MQHHGKLMQGRIAKTFGLDRLHRRGHVVAVGAGLAVALPHVMQLLGEREPAGILDVAAIGDVADRACGSSGLPATPTPTYCHFEKVAPLIGNLAKLTFR